jgi:hypothetical protein
VILSHHPCRSTQYTCSHFRAASKSLPHTILANALQLTSIESHFYKNHTGAGVRCLHSIFSPAHFRHGEKTFPANPLFATHTSRAQITENTNTLSPAFATHTDFSPVSPVFATHTKTAGVYTNNSHFGIPQIVVRTDRCSFFSYIYKCPLQQTLSFDILTNARGIGLLMFFFLSTFNFRLPSPRSFNPSNSRSPDAKSRRPATNFHQSRVTSHQSRDVSVSTGHWTRITGRELQ